MKILKLGSTKEKTTKKTCNDCKTKFEYTDSDVQYDNREGGTYLFCPHCNKFITITSPSYSYIDRSKDC